MSMQDLPVGRRRDDYPNLVQPASVNSAPPWDAVLERLTTLERSHADLARFVASIHEALPPEIAARTGRTLALGSPIDAVSPAPPSFSVVGPVVAALQPLPERVDPPAVAVDAYSSSYQATDPWAAPPAGDSFFEPLAAPAMPFPVAAEPPKRRGLLRGRRAAKEAQARIAAEFAVPPPPPGFGTRLEMAPALPSFGSGAEPSVPDQGLPSGWGSFDAAPVHAASPGIAEDFPSIGFAAPPAWTESAPPAPPAGFGPLAAVPPPPPGFGEPLAAAPPPTGFVADLAEQPAPMPDVIDRSWGPSGNLASPADFDFDAPQAAPGYGFNDPAVTAATPPPPPPGFAGGLESVPPPPPPPGFAGGLESVPPPPPPPGFAGGLESMPPPPPAGFGPEAAVPPPPPGFGEPSASPAPPSGFTALHTSEIFDDMQEVTSLVPQEVAPIYQPEPGPEPLADTGTDHTSYTAVPPITPDFFARAAGKGRR